jgi:hypothetical protein
MATREHGTAVGLYASNDWTRWSIAAGIVGLQATGPEFEYYGQALQTAADGVGIAMGIRPYLDDDLRAGRLWRYSLRVCPKALNGI